MLLVFAQREEGSGKFISPEVENVSEMEDIGEPQVSLRTTCEHKKRKGLGPRARLAATDMGALRKTTPVLKPFVDHVRDRFPEKADVLDLARHDTTGFALPSQASTREDISFKRAGKAGAAEQRRKECLLIESEDKLMADYVDLCTQESNLHDEAHYDAQSKVAVKAAVVSQLIRQIRSQWLDAKKGVVDAAADISPDSTPRRSSSFP